MTSIFQKTMAVIVVSALLTACERPDKEDGVAGKGGQATLKVTPQHHGVGIPGATVYIKYNTQDKPGSYDDSTVCVQDNGKPVATFSGLKKGNYYLYGHGYDPDIAEDVNGGIPYIIAEEKTHDIILPVTEKH